MNSNASGSTKEFEVHCEETVEYLKNELGRMRGGRAQSSLLEGITVDYYGSQVPLKQLAMVNTPESRLITVQVYDKSSAEAVEKAIRSSSLGLNPARDGNLIRVAVPTPTEERRKEFVKVLNKTGEEAKVGIRNHRRDILDKAKKQKKDGEISEDDLSRLGDQVQAFTDKYISKITEMVSQKEKEILEV